MVYAVFPRIHVVSARSINFTVCVMRGLFEGAVYSEGANYLSKYGNNYIDVTYVVLGNVHNMIFIAALCE